MRDVQEAKLVRIGVTNERERRRRRYELLAALALLLVATGGTWAQLTFYEVDSWVFIALFNINSLFMLIVLFLVARNVVKLIMERRRKVFGARIRSRMVAVFVSLSLVPTVLMFLASNRVVGTSVDYWFTWQTESSLDAALEVGQLFYEAAADRLRARSEAVVREVRERQLNWGGSAMDQVLIRKQEEYGLTVLGLVSSKLDDELWHAPAAFEPIWQQTRGRIDWTHVAARGFGSLLWATADADYVIGVLAVDGGNKGYLVSAERIGQGLMQKLDRITRGFDEYAQLKHLKKPLKVSFQLILGVLGLIIVFGSVWFGFQLSKEMTAPILALAEGTTRLARGEMDFRLEDKGTDELALLVKSFNHMAEELSEGRKKLTRVNALLARRNEAVADRNRYIEAVLDNITTGVITLNGQGLLVTMNKSVCAMFNVNSLLFRGRSPALFLPAPYTGLFTEMLETFAANPDQHWQRHIDFTMGKRTWKLVLHAVALRRHDPMTTLPETGDPAAAEGMVEAVAEGVAEGTQEGTVTRGASAGMTTASGTETRTEVAETTPNMLPESAPAWDATGASPGGIVAYVVVVEDVTELEKMQRMAAWREVARRIAHEIKNPLTPIKLSAQRLERKFGPATSDPAFCQCTRLIVRQVERLQEMVQEFSAFAKLPEVTLSPGEIGPVLEELLALFRASHSRFNWELRLQTPLPRISMDSAALHRALLNILTNAAEALEGCAEDNPRRVRITALHERSRNVLRIIVSDSGPGLSPEERERIFEPYFSRKSGGTGLGLAIVKSIVADHHGRIRVTGTAAGGTVMILDFPVIRA